MSKDLLAFPPYCPKLPPLDLDDRHAAMLGIWSSHRDMPADQRLAMLKRYGLIGDGPSAPPAANDTGFVIPDAALDRILARVDQAMQEPFDASAT